MCYRVSNMIIVIRTYLDKHSKAYILKEEKAHHRTLIQRCLRETKSLTF